MPIRNIVNSHRFYKSVSDFKHIPYLEGVPLAVKPHAATGATVHGRFKRLPLLLALQAPLVIPRKCHGLRMLLFLLFEFCPDSCVSISPPQNTAMLKSKSSPSGICDVWSVSFGFLARWRTVAEC